ncbi:alpha/beta hydrolase family protein [Streptomyces sp. NPDC059786]|uniref:alpha/beta hydrolase family protein n=1 Tax=Streptomyces sp. NPDC059786 TaxID=3346946 RepID=UPI003659F05D
MPTDLTEVSFTGETVTLAGSLTVPQGPGTPVGGVVMIGGSGPADRDNGGYFPPIRDRLVRAGLAVLSYDKRGVGDSKGDWQESTLDDLADDASAALDFLRAQPRVRADAVGLLGHSEGGWVALRAGAGRADLAWLVTSSCPGTTPAEQERHALAESLRDAAGRPETDAALALYDRLVEAGRRDADHAEARTLLGDTGTPPGSADLWEAATDARFWRFLKRKQDHDPLADAVRLRCPHLAVFGGADPLVPVAKSARAFVAAACRPGRPARATLTVEVVPGADHRLRTDHGVRPAPAYLDLLAGWITGRTPPHPDETP